MDRWKGQRRSQTSSVDIDEGLQSDDVNKELTWDWRKHMLWVLLATPLLVWAAPRVPYGDEPEESPGYKEAARHLYASMNLSADPCVDFYDFACGKWIANNPIPGDQSSFGTFQKLRLQVQEEMRELYDSDKTSPSKAIRMLKMLYNSCMDEAKINEKGPQDLIASMKSFGYWPIMHNELWEASSFDLTELLIHLSVTRGKDIFLDIYAGTDIKNVSRRVLQLDQGELGLGSDTRDYYLDKKKFAKQMKAYRTFLIGKARLLTEDAGLPLNISKIEADVDELIEFETKYAGILVAADERRNYTELYNLRKLSDLDTLMPLIDWGKYFRAVMPFETHDYLNGNPDVVITEIAYLTRLSELLKSTDPRIITNYVLMRYTSSWSMQLGTKYEDLTQDFARDMYGRKEKAPRWKDCISTVNPKLTYASGALYVRTYFDKASKNTTLNMIGDLQESFQNMLVENDWMDKNTKEFASEKAKQIINQIGYPDFILDNEKLDDWYKGLDITEGDSFSEMHQKHTTYSTNFHYKRLLEPVDRSEFTSNPSTVNAFYSSIKNAIMFPAAILQVPFFHHTFPKALNYGGIGAVIGHEITHGFDDQGRQFDAVGNLREWWDASTSERFEERAKCIVDQYSAIEIPEVKLKINGKLTQGENIADNGGIKEAFKAYNRYLKRNGPEDRISGLEQFDNQQMFFIGYSQTYCSHSTPESRIRQLLTDPHSPSRIRVNVVLMNQPEFAQAFQCAAGAPMNPAHRCTVW